MTTGLKLKKFTQLNWSIDNLRKAAAMQGTADNPLNCSTASMVPKFHGENITVNGHGNASVTSVSKVYDVNWFINSSFSVAVCWSL